MGSSTRFGLLLLLLALTSNAFLYNGVAVEYDRGITFSADPPRLDLYSSEYSGRVLRLYGDVFGSIRGLLATEIIAGAYDGSKWVRLPVRIYDSRIEGNFSVVYMMPEKIDSSTIIDVRLPGFKPVKVDPYRVTPKFARGAGGVVEVALYDRREPASPLAYIYLFYDETGNATYWNSIHYQYLYTVDYVGSNDPFESEFMPALYRYYRQLGYSDAETAERVRSAIEDVIDVKASENLKVATSINSDSLPDGGGGFTYDLVELRPQPKTYLLQEDITFTQTMNTRTLILYTIDPDSPPTVKWKYIRLVMDVYREEGSGSVVRELVVNINNGDHISSHPIYAFGSEFYRNKIVVDYTLSPYGTRQLTLPIVLTLNDVTPGEKWKLTMTVTVYIIWSDIPVNSLREKPVKYTIINNTNIEFSITTSKLMDVRTIYLKPLTILSTPNPDQTVRTTIAISSQSSNNLYPLIATISLAGISTCTVTLNHNEDTKNCTLTITRAGLLSLFSMLDSVPLIIKVKALHSLNIAETVTLYMQTKQPFTFTSRMMYIVHNSNGDSQSVYMLTSTRYDPDIVWIAQGFHFTIGKAIYNSANSIDDKNIVLQSLESSLSWRTGVTGSTDIKITFNSYGYPELLTECIDQECYTLIRDSPTEIFIIIDLDGFNLAPYNTRYSPKISKFDRENTHYMRILESLTIIISKISIIKEFFSYIKMDIWIFSLLKELLSDDVDVDMNYENNIILIQWDKGLLSSTNQVNIELYFYGIIIEQPDSCLTQKIHVYLLTKITGTTEFNYEAVACTIFG